MLAQLVWGCAVMIIVVVLVTFAVGLVIRHVCPKPLLITFAYSHYAEMARWALVLSGTRFTEWKVPVGPHILLVPLLRLLFSPASDDLDEETSYPGGDVRYIRHPWWSLARMRRFRRLSGVPLLIGTDFRCVRTSWGILRRCGFEVDPPTRRALDHDLGPSVRLLIYHCIFTHSPSLYRELQSCETWGELQLFDLCESLCRVSAYIKALLGVSPTNAAAAANELRSTFSDLSETILCADPFFGKGDGATDFGGADLAFAALSAPLFMPPSYARGALRRLPLPSELGAEYESLRADLLESRAGKLVMQCYEEHRQRPPPPPPLGEQDGEQLLEEIRKKR